MEAPGIVRYSAAGFLLVAATALGVSTYSENNSVHNDVGTMRTVLRHDNAAEAVKVKGQLHEKIQF
jgi:hypothetical protein